MNEVGWFVNGWLEWKECAGPGALGRLPVSVDLPTTNINPALSCNDHIAIIFPRLSMWDFNCPLFARSQLSVGFEI